MKQFIKDNICLVVISSIVLITILGLSIWGITKLVSSDDKKQDNNQINQPNTSVVKGKYDSINDAKCMVDSNDIERLYNYILGIGYNNGWEGAFEYTSELYQDKIVKLEDLSDEAIVRAGISQLVMCGSQYENEDLPYNKIEEKIKDVFGKVPNIELNISVDMTASGGYGCDDTRCVPVGGYYCTELPLKNDYKLVNVIADFEDSNILYFYEETEQELVYRHTFRKSNDEYYWYSTEPMGK